MANIEIQGLETFKSALNSLPTAVGPPTLRKIATPVANRAAAEARRMQPIGNTGATARTIGTLRVKNQRQPFVEVGYRGRSLGHIYTSGDMIVRSKRGTIRGFPQLFHKAGDNVRASGKAQMKVDITKVLVGQMRKYGYR